MSYDSIILAAVKARLGIASVDVLVRDAVVALQGGAEAPSLILLAGYGGSDSREAVDLLYSGVKELGLRVPEGDAGIELVCKQVAKEIAGGVVSPIEGARRIWDITLMSDEGHVPGFDEFIYAASEWDERPADHGLFEAAVLEAARELADGL